MSIKLDSKETVIFEDLLLRKYDSAGGNVQYS
jgi:hypothetical protein